ncbi:molecular chaperone [Pseudomonas sp. B21-012]|uniref:fimbrial biogenesis chaperone n=1 Tax=Pseudomonas sp. B21-012 TaxID=2895472 RepID=UPI00215EBBFF|nr:molecular chaperone [Pseudomonas sp. B21-012]UVM58097.1 molecular chaperone [Pseudomonas sp. B21-012]
MAFTSSTPLSFINVILLWLAVGSSAEAMIKIDGTRLIYTGQHREATLRVTNVSSQTVALQAWVSSSEENSSDVPFALAHPLIKLNPQQVDVLRILYSGEGLPEDRESLFWLNVMEIPLKPDRQNSVQMAVRQQLKLFFRPPGLQGTSSSCIAGLSWKVKNVDSIEVTNTCAFHLSLVDLRIESSDRSTALDEYTLLKPGETHLLRSTVAAIPADAKIIFTEINDIGLRHVHEANIQ